MGKKAKAKDKKKFVNYRISPVSIELLNSVASELGWTKTKVVEELVRRYIPKLIDQEAGRIAESAAKYRATSKQEEEGVK